MSGARPALPQHVPRPGRRTIEARRGIRAGRDFTCCARLLVDGPTPTLDPARRCPCHHAPRPIHDILRAAHRARLRRLSSALGVVDRRRARSMLGCDLGLLRRTGFSALRAGPRSPYHAWGDLVRRCAAELRRARASPGGRTSPRRCDRRCFAIPRPSGAHMGPAVRAGGEGPGRPAASRSGRGGSRRRLSAEHPRDRRCLPGGMQPGGDLDLVCPRVRRASGARSVQPGRADRAVRSRRISVRAPRCQPRRRADRDPCRPAQLAKDRDGAVSRRFDHRAPGRSTPGHDGVGRPDGRGRADRVRSGRARSPALRLVFLRHDRSPQADPARPRRGVARALQGDRPAQRHGRRRPVLLVHHHRLDDVELRRVGLARRRAAGAVRRRPEPRRPGNAVAAGRRRACHLVRRWGAVLHGVPPRRHRARRAVRPDRAAGDRLDRRAAAGRCLPVGVRGGLARRAPVADLRRHRRVLGLRRWQSAHAGLGGRDPVQLSRCGRSSVR